VLYIVLYIILYIYIGSLRLQDSERFEHNLIQQMAMKVSELGCVKGSANLASPYQLDHLRRILGVHQRRKSSELKIEGKMRILGSPQDDENLMGHISRL
jgi:hypothetical protein